MSLKKGQEKQRRQTRRYSNFFTNSGKKEKALQTNEQKTVSATVTDSKDL